MLTDPQFPLIPANLLRLMAWLSPAFPVGAFGYSHGLEQAISEGLVADGDTLFSWVEALLIQGSGWNDAVLFSAAYDAAPDNLAEIADLAFALCTSAERLRETRDQGGAFAIAADQWAEAVGGAVSDPSPLPYPLAVARRCAEAGVPPDQAITAYLHAFASNLVSIAMRATPLGQSTGVAVLARLEPVILATAERAAQSTLDDLGGSAMVSDILSMRHETLETRIFVT